MAKKSVLESTCDQCGKQEIMDLPVKDPRAEFVLPNGWVHVRGDDKHKSLFALDFCTDCAKVIRNLIKVKNGGK
jgi:hypothetical protein